MFRFLMTTAAIAGALLSCGANWLQFRGQRGNAVAHGAQPPVKWEADQVAWKADLPGRGVSSPIVVKNRVIVTCNEGVNQDKLLVLAFDKATGKLAWRRQFWSTGRNSTHPTSANAAPTPASDGERIYAFYSSNDLICLDLNGVLQWYRGLTHDYPKAGNDVGMSSSPLVVDETVVVQIENQGDSFAMGLNKRTGETRWRTPRDPRANWASPIAMPSRDGKKQTVLLQSPSGLTAHDPQTGEQLWKYEASCAGIASPVTAPGRVYLPSKGTTLLEIADESNSPEIVWDNNRISAGSSSFILGAKRLYALNNSGVLTCGNAETGKDLWKLRVGGRYWGTPILANGHIYGVNQSGKGFVVDVRGEKGKIVHRFEVGESVLASLAIVDQSIYVRTGKHLICIQK